jgi:catechol 2,3-dioxygenase-like lactoylglutathione lyase family enzyme
VSDFPGPGVESTQILVVADVGRARDWYTNILGADLYREYGGTSVVLTFAGAWLLLVTGGGPTPDKPDVSFAPPADPRTVSHAITIRVPDCQAAYETLRDRGAVFLTPAGRERLGDARLLPRSGRPPLRDQRDRVRLRPARSSASGDPEAGRDDRVHEARDVGDAVPVHGQDLDAEHDPTLGALLDEADRRLTVCAPGERRQPEAPP